MRLGTGILGAASCLMAAAAAGQESYTVAVKVSGVRSDAGAVMATLCDDPANVFCSTYAAMAQAEAGATELVFEGVAPGRYLLAAFHDENGDYRAQIPPEGYAYGNGVGWPPDFETASIVVEGDSEAPLALTYLSAAMVGMAPTGSTGAPAPDGIVKTDLREGGLYGELYAPEDAEGKLPGLILLGGSEGGIDAISGMAPSFAKEGYAVLALAYWGEIGLPQTLEHIPLEYFDAAVAWLQTRPEVDPGAIGAAGWSRGSEAALLLASRNPDIRAVMGIAPSGIVWRGLDFADPANMEAAWTAGGEDLPNVLPDGASYVPGGAMGPMFVNALDEADARPETEIPVERINGPVLLVSGDDDAMWPSATFAGRIVERLERADFPHEVRNLVYPGAGHAVFVGAPDSIMARSIGGPSPMMGGSAAANAAAWADNWPAALDFFDAALKGGDQ